MSPARAWHLLTAVVTSFALVLQLVLVVEGSSVLMAEQQPGLLLRLVRFVAYFTIQSNILVALTSIRLARDPSYDGGLWRVVRLDAMVGITVTGVVHWFALRPLLHFHGSAYVADKLLHVVVPLLAVAGWLVFGPRPRLELRTAVRSLVWPVVWVVVILTIGLATGWYPYPFLNVHAHGAGHVALACAGVTVLFVALGGAALLYDRRMRPQPRVTGS